MTLALDGLRKSYGPIRAVDGVSLTLEPGETLALLGPSGCGKSTLLRLVAGLEAPEAGRVRLAGRDITPLPPQRRGFGMVFQDYALFPHLDVAANIAFGPVEQGWPPGARRERVTELLALVGLPGYERRRVFELSGGQQQRVALARALAPRPPLLLLDEPLSNLDLSLREELQGQLARLLSGLETSAVYVTHDQTEAFALADRIALMRAGRVVQLDAPGRLFARPADVWAARFLGHANIYRLDEHPGLERLRQGGKPSLLLRGDLMRLGEGELRAVVASHTMVGGLHRIELALTELGVTLHWSGYGRELPAGLASGRELRLGLPPEAVVGLDGDPA